jgi:Terminase large subunit, T4likevirus-type, N-terminal
MGIDIHLHAKQSEIFQSKARFKVAVAGRRSGKTYLSYAIALKWATDTSMGGKDIYYVAPTFGQAMELFWDEFISLAGDLIDKTHVNTGVISLKNGVKIKIKGADRPEVLRGKGLRGLIMDEYADMKPDVWEKIIRPMLADHKAPALFIGSPKGRNHFYLMAMKAEKDTTGIWGYWHFTTRDNPHIDPEEIESAREELSTMAFQQEFEASFESGSSGLFLPEWIIETQQVPRGGYTTVVTVDLTGYDAKELASSSNNKRLDNCAITTGHIKGKDWVVEKIDYGRWTVAETAARIVAACKDADCRFLGIEKGLSLQALASTLYLEMREQNWHPHLELLTHGNATKVDRIVNSLQAGLEKGRIKFIPGNYMKELRDQLLQFPDPKAHDDLVDSVSMIEQMQKFGIYLEEEDQDSDSDHEYSQPLNDISGY